MPCEDCNKRSGCTAGRALRRHIQNKKIIIHKETNMKTMAWEIKGQGRMAHPMSFLQIEMKHEDSLIKCNIRIKLAADH